jgi:hypothetical protein
VILIEPEKMSRFICEYICMNIHVEHRYILYVQFVLLLLVTLDDLSPPPRET